MSNPLGNNGGRLYSSLVKPMLIEGSYTVASANGRGVTNVKGANIGDVFMHTSGSPTRGASGMLNPNPAVGYALIRLTDNYARYLGNFAGFVSNLSGSSLGISGGSLSVGQPYVITAVGASSAGAATISPVSADVSGSYASKYFQIFDGYGNTWVLWFYVTNVGGSAPVGVSGTLVQVTIAANSTQSQITSALSGVITLLPSGVSGVLSFTASGGGTGTLTITSTQANPAQPLPGAPKDGTGTLATLMTFVNTVTRTNLACWQAVGLPPGVIPAVGVSFVATAVGNSTGGSSTGLVQAPGTAGVSTVQVVGDPNLSLSPIPMGGSPNPGGFILLQFLGAVSSLEYNSDSPSESTVADAFAPVTLADGTLVRFAFLIESSTITIAGD